MSTIIATFEWGSLLRQQRAKMLAPEHGENADGTNAIPDIPVNTAQPTRMHPQSSNIATSSAKNSTPDNP